MGCPSFALIGDYLTFSVCTHDPDTGVLTDADAVPSYRVYEDETGSAILNGDMAKLDDGNTTGFYTERIECSAANGFEDRKTYTIYIEATVDSDKGGISFGFVAYAPTRGTAGTALPAAAADAAGGLAISDAGGLDLDAKLANTNEVTAARMGALTDWINGGRLDLIIDAIKVQTDFVTEARMGALTDLIDGGRLDLLVDAIKTQTDLLTAARAGALTDLIDGGRLDLLVDAIKAKTDNLPSDPADQSAVEAAVAALNDITVAEVWAYVIDIVTAAVAMKEVLAYASGNITKSSNAYAYKDRAGTSTVFTNTAATDSRTRS